MLLTQEWCVEQYLIYILYKTGIRTSVELFQKRTQNKLVSNPLDNLVPLYVLAKEVGVFIK